MVFQMPQYWDAVIDGIQIILCFIILVFIIRSRKKNRIPAPDKAIRESGQSFNEQIFTQTLRQQVDQAFANIAETIAVEQRKLEQVLPISEPGGQAYGILQCQSDLLAPVDLGISQTGADAAGSDLLHEQIQKLAVKGMSARQISEDLKTPLGEVELVLSLRSNM
jgi:hypothetical protein